MNLNDVTSRIAGLSEPRILLINEIQSLPDDEYQVLREEARANVMSPDIFVRLAASTVITYDEFLYEPYKTHTRFYDLSNREINRIATHGITGAFDPIEPALVNYVRKCLDRLRLPDPDRPV